MTPTTLSCMLPLSSRPERRQQSTCATAGGNDHEIILSRDLLESSNGH